MKHRVALALCLLLLFSLLGCEVQSLEVPTELPISSFGEPTVEFTREYYANDTPMEYLYRLRRIFVSLVPLLPRDKDLGVALYWEEFAADDPMTLPDQPETYQRDEATTITYVSRSVMPVFYGLLAETERFLSDHSINYDELAIPYGRAHALKAADVQALTNMLLGKEVELSFGSVAGAEFIQDESLFVYDVLENPYQEFLDKGWTLEISGSDCEQSTAGWGKASNLAPSVDIFGWYDAESATLYDLYGDVLLHTHAIDKLRTEFYGRSVADFSGVNPRGAHYNPYGVMLSFPFYKTITLDTPIEYLNCGSQSFYITPSIGCYNPTDQGKTLEQQVRALETDFFDDYYRDAHAGEKVSNYFAASFYSRPEDVDITVLPTQDQAELAQWCEMYLGISVDELSSDPATVGTAESETPYIAFVEAEISDPDKISAEDGDLLYLSYYNEIQRQDAVLTLLVVGDGYQFVSNLPAE